MRQESAAKLLQRNYDALGSWPLAITAYNYGHNGLKRIVKRMSSSDLGYLIRYYHYPAFGFAAKNFYAEFLAAKEVAENYQLYFGKIQFDPKPSYRLVRLLKRTSIHKVARQFSVSPRKIFEYNLAFQDSIVKGHSLIPKNYVIRLPMYPEKYILNDVILIKKGDTLYSIAKQCGMSLAKFKKLNNIETHTIYPGQRLRCNKIQQRKTIIQKLRKTNIKKSTTSIKIVIVKKGDTLYSLAREHRIKVKELIGLNQLKQSIIYPGQKIIVKL